MKYKFNTNNVWTMLCFMLFFFQQPRLSIFSIWTSIFCLPTNLVTIRRKFYNTIQCKDILDSLFIITMDVPLNGFCSIIMSWSAFKSHCLPFLARYSLRHDIMLSAYYVYIYKLSQGLPFLECLNTVVGIKVTDRSF